MKSAFGSIAILLTSACSNGPNANVPSPSASAPSAPSPGILAASSSAAIAPSASAMPASAPAVGPAWLDPKTPPDKIAKLRAVVARLGSVYLDETGAPLNSPSGASARIAAYVLDEPKDSTTPKVRLLCDDRDVRVALYFDRSDLATVATKGAVLSPSGMASPSSDPSSAVGLHFTSGTIVTLDPKGTAGASKVQVRTKNLEADGFVAPGGLDQVYELDDPNGAFTTDLELPRGAEFYDRPGGTRFAKLLPPGADDPHHYAAKIGSPQKGMVQVRARTSAGALVGWVNNWAAVSHAPVPVSERRGEIGLGKPNAIILPQGAFLDRGDPPRRVGVVRKDAYVSCKSRCDAGMPTLSVDVCGAKVELESEEKPIKQFRK